MKIILSSFFFVSFFFFGAFFAFGEIDKIAKLDISSNKLPIKKESDQWIRITVPFKFLSHPKIADLQGSRPSTLNQAFNPDFIDNVKVKLWICFANKFKQNLLGSGNNLKDADFYQYYSSEIEYLTLEFDRSTKNATFLFPTAIAERDGFLQSSIKPVGYVIEILHEESKLELSNAAYFNYRGVTENILETFISEAISKSSENEGVLVPAHKINPSYLIGMGPVNVGK